MIDHQKRAAVYVSKSLTSYGGNDLEPENTESFNLSKPKPIFIGTVYRPPSGRVVY